MRPSTTVPVSYVVPLRKINCPSLAKSFQGPKIYLFSKFRSPTPDSVERLCRQGNKHTVRQTETLCIIVRLLESERRIIQDAPRSLEWACTVSGFFVRPTPFLFIYSSKTPWKHLKRCKLVNQDSLTYYCSWKTVISVKNSSVSICF